VRNRVRPTVLGEAAGAAVADALKTIDREPAGAAEQIGAGGAVAKVEGVGVLRVDVDRVYPAGLGEAADAAVAEVLRAVDGEHARVAERIAAVRGRRSANVQGVGRGAVRRGYRVRPSGLVEAARAEAAHLLIPVHRQDACPAE